VKQSLGVRCSAFPAIRGSIVSLSASIVSSNDTFDRTAGSHARAAAGQRER
jgi:hypothetical protein